MAGLYVKLDAEYDSDDKMIEAGPYAELLYVRGLCFAKRTMLDGSISRGQLAIISRKIPNPTAQAQRLVAVGAWTATRQGWRITAWLKRNKSASTIGAESEAKRLASQSANHERWHVKEQKPSATCPLCDPTWETKFLRTGLRPDSTEEETKTETETEEESSSEPDPSQPTPADDTGPDDDSTFVNRLIDAVATVRTKAHCRNPQARPGYHATVVAQLNRDERPALAAFLEAKPHMRTAAPQLAAQVYDAARQVAS
jgi:hypothetical protein